jgi:Holliday junction resolvase RusA-like endonuclease
MRPRPAARARHRHGQAAPYKKNEVFEAQAHIALLHTRYAGAFPKGTPVELHLTFLCHRWRGDVDNLSKLVMDALQPKKLGSARIPGQGVQPVYGAGVYHDDRQVRRKVVEWHRVAKDQPEGVQLHMQVWVPPHEGAL